MGYTKGGYFSGVHTRIDGYRELRACMAHCACAGKSGGKNGRGPRKMRLTEKTAKPVVVGRGWEGGE